MMSKTLQTQIARYEAIESAPEHQMHVINGQQIDTFKCEESGKFVSVIPEQLSCGTTREEAIQSLQSALKLKSEFDAGQRSVAAQWIPVGTEAPHGWVMLVVIKGVVQHMPAIWDGEEWTWLDASDDDDPIPAGLITHYFPLKSLPSPPTVAPQAGKQAVK